MKKRALILLVLSIVVFGGGAWLAQETNLFLSPRAKQLAYLKEHQKEIEDFVKSKNSKIESVQIDWRQTQWDKVGNGTPQGGGYMMTVNGRINNNKDTQFTLGFPLKHNLNETPEKLVIIQMQPIRILKGNLWDLYE